MNARRIATGALLVASLTLGGGTVATADSRPALDRFEVPCARLEHRLAHLQEHQDALASRRADLEARRDAALADGDLRRAARLDHRLSRLAQAQERITALIDQVSAAVATHCTDGGPPE